MATQGNNQGGQQGQQQGEKVEIDVGGAHIQITEQGGAGRGQASNQGQGGGGGNEQGGRGQAATSADNRGKVLHPERDGRLKGNEAQRPNDPDRSAQAEGGRRGGQNSRGGNNNG